MQLRTGTRTMAGLSKPRTQKEIEDAYDKFEKGELLFNDFLKLTLRNSPKTELAEPAAIHDLNITGAQDQGAIAADGTMVPITDTVASILTEHDGHTKAQLAEAYGKEFRNTTTE